MKKRKYLLLTLLVLTLALAMIACGKDKKKDKDKDDDDKATKTEETVKPNDDAEEEDAKTGEEDTKTGEEETKTGEEETKTPDEPAPAEGNDATSVIMAAAEALKGLGKVNSCSVGVDLDANVTYSGQAVVAKGTVGVEATVDPAVMKVVIDADAMGKKLNYNIYAAKEDGKWFVTVDANGQKMKMDADKAKEGISAQIDEAFAKIASADLASQDTTQLKAVLEQYGSMLSGLTVSESDGKIVLAGTVSEETIKSLAQSLSSLNKNAAQYAAMIPSGFGGIDFSFTFDGSTKLFESFSIDLSKLADALTQQTGSVAKIAFKMAYNNVDSIEVPEAELADPSALSAQ